MILRIDIAVKCTLLSVRQVGRIVDVALASHVGRTTANSVQLAVVEACTNLVKHGAEGDESKPLHVAVELDEGEIRIIFFDRGQSFDAGRVSKPHVDPSRVDELPTRGMGLPIIHDVMDSVRYDSGPGGNVMIMRKSVKPQVTTAGKNQP